jgi:NAD(P)-dependent dehydrogenase (short-subunit alcohol dehydrogenase family)
MGKRVQGKVCLVLGATSGIGRAAVARLAEEGGRIVFGARRAEKGKEFETQLKNSGYEVEFIQTDVTKSADLQHIVDATMQEVWKDRRPVQQCGSFGVQAVFGIDDG